MREFMTIVESAMAARSEPVCNSDMCSLTYHVSIRRRRPLMALLAKAKEYRPDIEWHEYDTSPAASSFDISAPTDVIKTLNDHLRPIVRESADDGKLYLD